MTVLLLELTLELATELTRVVLDVSTVVVVVDPCDDGSGYILCSEYLNEGVFMCESFLTDFAVVEVLADTAFVANARDWTDPATIASHIQVMHNG